MSRLSFNKQAALLVGLLVCTGFTIPGPCTYDPQPYYDCGNIYGDPDCSVDDDCKSRDGDGWQCLDEHCVKGCPSGFSCGADGFCKVGGCDSVATTAPLTGGDMPEEPEFFRCGSQCVPVSEMPNRGELCCLDGGCEQGKSCCPARDASGAIEQGAVVCLDLENDPNNCGTCGNGCGIGGRCAGGRCLTSGQCVAGDGHTCSGDIPLCCGGYCSDGYSDPGNCGQCGRRCADDFESARFCNQGTCITGADNDCCGSACQDCLMIGQSCDPTTFTCQP